jgi:hypothetical protein
MKPKNLDEIVEETNSLKQDLKEHSPEVYIQHHPRLITYLEDYWNAMKPHSMREAQLMALSFPTAQIPYYLWKLPPEMHQYLNTALGYATSILARTQPEAALATGVFYGLSQAIYGIKTKSGKDLVSGLVGLLTHLKKVPEAKEFSRKAMQWMKDYFSNTKK